ncbi:MAG: 30S ribosomal protein S17 [Acidobacteria bacterium]|nr:30S ribosomal protein S17 [Acidobacteriota bacterium]
MSAPEKAPNNKNEKTGQVLASKMAKTIVVEVTRRVPHPIYKRIITKRSKFYAHDEQGQAKAGDTVRIVEARPLSKLKRWTLDAILRQAVQVGSTAADQTREALPSVKKKA